MLTSSTARAADSINIGRRAIAAEPEENVEPFLGWSRRIVMVWLIGTFLLLPLELFNLPFNVSLVDVWTMAAIPVVWLLVPRGKQKLSMYYTIPMWLILMGSFASTLPAPEVRNGLVVILKEIFVYIWFITFVIALVRLAGKDLHRVFWVWGAVVLGHGLIIVAQFASPELWRFMADVLGRGGGYDIYRPSGLFPNANSAAFFQLLGFVPLMLARPARRIGALLGLILLGTMLATGSMAALISFVVGSMVALPMLIAKGRIAAIARLVLPLAMAAALLGTVLFILFSQNERYQAHVVRILLGRAERSSESRFDLWERGTKVIVDQNLYVLGVGPENFRVVDPEGKQLHNDFMAFAVERGLISILGLGMFAMLAIVRAINLFMIVDRRRRDDSELVVIVLLAAMVAAFVYSLTHQVFHNRQLWLILALQEALYFKVVAAGIWPVSSGDTLEAMPGTSTHDLTKQAMSDAG